MNNPLKIGAVAGLIAGIVGAILAIHYSQWMFSLGLPYMGYFFPPQYPPLSNIIIIESTMNLIWGTALGIFYARIYDQIPGKHFYKGLVYGIILAVIFSIRWVTFDIAYSWIDSAKADFIFTYFYIVIGLLLGVLYEILRKKYDVIHKELKASKFDLRMGIMAGAIGGLLGGMAISFAHVLFWDPVSFSKYVGDLEFLTAQFGTHSFINMCWGAFFGVLYAKFYDRIPGEKIWRGIVFGMIIYFIISFQVAIYGLLYNEIGLFIPMGNAVILFFINGLILGVLYKKE
jgi:hypothetical protein